MGKIMGKILTFAVCALVMLSAPAQSAQSVAKETQAASQGKLKQHGNRDNSRVTPKKKPKVFEVKDFSFGVENPTQIGSPTGGAGAGKLKFNEFTVKQPPAGVAKPRFDTPRVSMPGGGLGGGGAAVRAR